MSFYLDRQIKSDLPLSKIAAAVMSLTIISTNTSHAAYWNGGGSGNWDDATAWSPNLVPNNSSTAVAISDGISTVALDYGGVSVGSLGIGSGNTLDISYGFNPSDNAVESATLTDYGALTNSGQINIIAGTDAGNAYNATLNIIYNPVLSGGGSINLSSSGGGIAFLVGSGILTNTDNTIDGAGVIGNNSDITQMTLYNQSVVNANANGQSLQLGTNGGVTNTGLLEASNGGTLNITAPIVNNQNGNITANSGSTVLLNGSDIQGGTLTNNGGTLGSVAGNVNTGAYPTLDGSTHGALTINGTYTNAQNSSTYALGAINNTGNFQINGGNGSNSTLNFSGNTVLQGGGSVTLSTASGGGSAFIVSSNTLTNADNTIQGAGNISNGSDITNLTLVNQGSIDANVNGQALSVSANGGITNTGLLDASNGGYLVLSNTVNNSGGTVLADVNSTVVLQNGINNQGGTIEGFGTISGSFSDSGTILPGVIGTPGNLTITGNYTQNSGGIFNEQLGSTIGLLTVNGNANFNGSLILTALNSLQNLTIGENFVIAAVSNTLTGSFGLSSTTPIYDTRGDAYTLSTVSGINGFTDLSLTVTSVAAVPLPGAVWLFGSSLLGLLGLRKKVRIA